MHPGARGALEAELLRELSTYLPHLLNRQDKNTMQASIETRVPFLDPNLAALALCLPLEARMEPGRKGLLRDLADRRLPREVARRQKRGFGFDVRRYIEPSARPEFLLDGALRELLGVDRERWAAAVFPARERRAGAAAVVGRGVVPRRPRRPADRGGRGTRSGAQADAGANAGSSSCSRKKRDHRARRTRRSAGQRRPWAASRSPARRVSKRTGWLR